MTNQNKQKLALLMDEFGAELHATSKSKGWWSDRDKLSLTLAGRVSVDIGCIMLAVSELAEAVESIRKGYLPDDKVPQFTGAEAEIADCIIRLLDLANARGWNVSGAMLAKAEFNKGRTNRHGGKLA